MKGWQTKSFSDVLDIKNGRNQKEVESDSGEYPIYGSAGNVMGYANSYICEAGTIIVGRKGNINSPIYAETRFWNVDTAFGLAAKPGLDSKFLYYYCLSFDFSALNRGTTIPSLVKSELLSISIPAPPLSEQQRIVSIIDKAFDGIAKARANAEQNLQNARALFESHLQSVFADAWQTGGLVTLTDLATDITDGDHMPPPKAPSGVPFITIGNVAKDTRTIDFTDTFKVSREYFNRLKPNKKPQKGDVLYTVTGSFGIPVLLEEQREFCFQRHIGLVRPKSEVSSEWLYYLLMSPQILKQANDGATGTAQKTVSLKLLRGFQVPLVPLEHQRAAAAKLKAVSAETQCLESIYKRKLAAIDDLKKSLLHQAFSGQL
ncbi:restriction endonuclease subunit S [Halothiobacillus sp.]|uniref:restriction endonuclease subunit S n=1 Tax=Halothiobacillus sp. TaxID=1891311 RepID=UPI002AD317F0|nr:restriction endonuclease subunit S [Halothiobacillus sp.]